MGQFSKEETQLNKSYRQMDERMENIRNIQDFVSLSGPLPWHWKVTADHRIPVGNWFEFGVKVRHLHR